MFSSRHVTFEAYTTNDHRGSERSGRPVPRIDRSLWRKILPTFLYRLPYCRVLHSVWRSSLRVFLFRVHSHAEPRLCRKDLPESEQSLLNQKQLLKGPVHFACTNSDREPNTKHAPEKAKAARQKQSTTRNSAVRLDSSASDRGCARAYMLGQIWDPAQRGRPAPHTKTSGRT